jgi:glycosyltransferase involved in cell wall biosynthesis
MRFSIITCTYNSAQYLQENIDSVAMQTYGDYEHIFIDGYSTDDTMAMIEQYRKKYPDRVKVFQSEPRGISHAMNEGIEKAQGHYVVHLHSDDGLHDTRVLEKVEAFLMQNDDPAWIYGKARVTNVSNGNSTIIPPRRLIYDRSSFWLLLFMNNYIPHQSVFIKKELFVQYGLFDETLKNYMDLDMWLRLTKRGVHARFFDAIICNFTIRPDAQSTVGRKDEENIILYHRYMHNRFMIAFFLAFSRCYKWILYKMSTYRS